jgi:hypothetical protein
MRVAILPTGRMEWNALPMALARLFPDHEFYSLPSQREIDSHPHDFPLASFTSTRLRKGPFLHRQPDWFSERLGKHSGTEPERVMPQTWS